MATLNKKLLATAEAAVADDLATYEQALNYREAANYCLEQLSRGLSSDIMAQMQCFFYGLWFLEKAHLHELGTPKNLSHTANLCEAVLRRSGVAPGTSKFSGLYNRIYAGLSQANLVEGDPWLAMWQSSMGEVLGGGDAGDRDVLAAGFGALKRRRIADAASEFYLAEASLEARPDLATARLGRIQAARLLGALSEAHILALTAQSEYADLPRQALAFRWQELIGGALLSGRAEPLFAAWDGKDALCTAENGLFAAHAVPHAVPVKSIRKVNTLRAKFTTDIAKGTRAFTLAKMLQVLEDCGDERQDMNSRLRNLGTFIAKNKGEWDPEEHLVFYAAIGRWLQAAKQKPFLKHILAENSALSLSLSDGKSDDVFGLCAGLSRYLPELPTSSAKRILRFSMLATQAGLLVLKYRVQSMTPKKREQAAAAAAEFITQFVRLLIDEVGSFKGPIMKLGQLIIGLSHIPNELRVELQRALASTMRMPTSIFESVVVADHGQHPSVLFRQWQSSPIGIGSMGRVFKAQLEDGTVVAVKITYPGLAKLVQSDMKLLRLLVPVMRSFFPGVDHDGFMDLLENCGLAECDLREEATRCQQMYDYFHTRPDLIIPRVHHQYTTRNMLVMDYIKGLKAFEYTNVTPEQRQQTYTTIRSVYIESIAKLNLVQYDPHGGNFLICGERVALLDFGSMYPVDPRIAQKFCRFIAALEKGDVDGFIAMLTTEGIFDRSKLDDPEVLRFIASFFIDRFHKRARTTRHNIGDFIHPVVKSRDREALVIDPALLRICLTSFMLNTMSFAEEAEPGPAPGAGSRGETLGVA